MDNSLLWAFLILGIILAIGALLYILLANFNPFKHHSGTNYKISSSNYIRTLREDIEQYRKEHDNEYLRGVNADEIISSFECLVLTNPAAFESGWDIIKSEDLYEPYKGKDYIKLSSTSTYTNYRRCCSSCGNCCNRKKQKGLIIIKL